MNLTGSQTELSVPLAGVQTMLFISKVTSISFSWLGFKIMGLFSVRGRIALQARFHGQRSPCNPKSWPVPRKTLTYLPGGQRGGAAVTSVILAVRPVVDGVAPAVCLEGLGRETKGLFRSIKLPPKAEIPGPRESPCAPLIRAKARVTPYKTSSKPKGTRRLVGHLVCMEELVLRGRQM